jgi:hypothetical protein
MNESYSSDAESVDPYERDNVFQDTYGGDPSVVDVPDVVYSSGLLSEEIAECVAEYPVDETENPFKLEPDELPVDWSYITHDQLVSRWEDNRSENVAKVRVFGGIEVFYYDKCMT